MDLSDFSKVKYYLIISMDLTKTRLFYLVIMINYFIMLINY